MLTGGVGGGKRRRRRSMVAMRAAGPALRLTPAPHHQTHRHRMPMHAPTPPHLLREAVCQGLDQLRGGPAARVGVRPLCVAPHILHPVHLKHLLLPHSHAGQAGAGGRVAGWRGVGPTEARQLGGTQCLIHWLQQRARLCTTTPPHLLSPRLPLAGTQPHREETHTPSPPLYPPPPCRPPCPPACAGWV